MGTESRSMSYEPRHTPDPASSQWPQTEDVQISIHAMKEMVTINLGRSVSYFTMTPVEARELATMIKNNADKAER